MASGRMEWIGVSCTYDAADAGAVPTEPLGEGVDDDSRAVRERLGHPRRAERRVDDQRTGRRHGGASRGNCIQPRVSFSMKPSTPNRTQRHAEN